MQLRRAAAASELRSSAAEVEREQARTPSPPTVRVLADMHASAAFLLDSPESDSRLRSSYSGDSLPSLDTELPDVDDLLLESPMGRQSVLEEVLGGLTGRGV
eukprot:PLAT7258.1.p2 GENE.PLAT7258.1~~PLAT7258.1.p2  ORF type:complete len:102 (+),score=29.97 PLAT7258.1:306-611(+)